jgi:hypothetical protein
MSTESGAAPHGTCVNCGLRLMLNGRTPVHAEGPQATKGTCALDPYGRFHARCKSIQCGACYPDSRTTPSGDPR